MKRTPELDAWLDEASKNSLPKMQQSGTYMGVVTSDFLKDPLCALQLGYAMILDKPIVLIADKNLKIPASLTKIAKVIERVDINNKNDMKRATESIVSMLRTLP